MLLRSASRWSRVPAARVVAAGALAVSLLVAGSPAGAVDTCEGDLLSAPDGRIRHDGEGSFVGGGQYPATSVGAKLAIGEAATFTLKWVNVDGEAATIRVNLLGQQRDPGYGIRYHAGGENVTPRIRAGKSLKFEDVPPRRARKVVVTIRNKSGAETSAVLLRLAGRYGGTDPLVCDELRAGVNLP